VNKVNKVNVVYMWKSATFTTYLHESKGLVNEVNVSPGYFGVRARRMPNSIFTNETQGYRGTVNRDERGFFNYSITRLPNHSIHLKFPVNLRRLEGVSEPGSPAARFWLVGVGSRGISQKSPE
jgi:hypothetical protein